MRAKELLELSGNNSWLGCVDRVGELDRSRAVTAAAGKRRRCVDERRSRLRVAVADVVARHNLQPSRTVARKHNQSTTFP